MTYGAFTRHEFEGFGRRRAPKRIPPAIAYAFVVVSSAWCGHWMATAPRSAPPEIAATPTRIEPFEAAARRNAPPATAEYDAAPGSAKFRVVTLSSDRFAGLSDQRFASGLTPATFDKSVVLGATFEPFPHRAAGAIAQVATAQRQAAAAKPVPVSVVPPLPLVVELARSMPRQRAGSLPQANQATQTAELASDASVVTEPSPQAPAVVERVADVPLPPPRPLSLSPSRGSRLRVVELGPADETAAAESDAPGVAERTADVPLPPSRPLSLSPSRGGRQQVAELTATDDTNAPDARIVPPLPGVAERITDVPLPPERPAFLSPPTQETTPRLYGRRRFEQRTTVARSVEPEPDRRSFFERLFGGERSSGQALAYASPGDGGGLGLGRSRLGSFDSATAIYDISAHTVYLPDGKRLEAHSGLGANLDNPGSVRQRMRGVTPPNVYELGARAELFHGVRAIRLNPTDNRAMYGRDGMLAHTYMLGPRGDSNGCVVFKDYRAFLEAFDRGTIRRLAVVSSLN